MRLRVFRNFVYVSLLSYLVVKTEYRENKIWLRVWTTCSLYLHNFTLSSSEIV